MKTLGWFLLLCSAFGLMYSMGGRNKDVAQRAREAGL